MPLLEQLQLSPLQKLFRHHKIPFKFIVNVMLIIVTAMQICYTSQEYNEHNLAVRGTLYNTFFPDDFQYAEDNLPVFATSYFLYTFDEFQSSLKKVVTQYYNFSESNIGVFYYATGERYIYSKDKDEAVPIVMTVNFFDEFESTEIHSFNYHLDESDPLGPFNMKDLSLLTELLSVDLAFPLITTDQSSDMFWKWDIHIIYDGSAKGGRIQMTLRSQPDSAFTMGDNVKQLARQSLLFWNNFLVLFLSIWHLLLALKQLFRHVSLYMRVRQRFIDRRKSSMLSWNVVSRRLALKLFVRWYLITAILGSVFNIIGSVANFTIYIGETQDDGITWRRLFVGLGCFFTCVSVTRFLEFDTKYYVLINTLKKGLPNILRSLFAVAPVFFGYALFGVAYFSQSTPKFYNLDNACVVLFAIANGDIVQDTYTQLYHASPIVSRIYLYTFISLFIYVVLNMLIQIMQEGYKIARFIGNPGHEKKRFKYTQGYQPLEDQIWKEISLAAEPNVEKYVDVIDGLNEDREPFFGGYIDHVLEDDEISRIIDKDFVESEEITPMESQSSSPDDYEIKELEEGENQQQVGKEEKPPEKSLKRLESAARLFKSPKFARMMSSEGVPNLNEEIREKFMKDVEKLIAKRNEDAMAETMEHIGFLVSDYLKLTAAATSATGGASKNVS